MRIFNGCSPNLITADVLVSGKLVKKIGAGLAAPKGAFEINGSRRTLIPGLINVHWHGVYALATAGVMMTTGEGYWNLMASIANRDALMRGDTAVGDAFSACQMSDT